MLNIEAATLSKSSEGREAVTAQADRAERQEKTPGHSELVTRAHKPLGIYQKAFGYQHMSTVHGDQKTFIVFKTLIVIIFL